METWWMRFMCTNSYLIVSSLSMKVNFQMYKKRFQSSVLKVKNRLGLPQVLREKETLKFIASWVPVEFCITNVLMSLPENDTNIQSWRFSLKNLRVLKNQAGWTNICFSSGSNTSCRMHSGQIFQAYTFVKIQIMYW